MNYQDLYKSKLISLDDVLKKIDSNMDITVGMMAGEPIPLLDRLHKIKNRVENVNVLTVNLLKAYDWYTKPEMKGHFVHDCFFYNAECRKTHHLGISHANPQEVHYVAKKRFEVRRNPDIFFGVASPMDKNGNFTLSCNVAVEMDYVDIADQIILEVNPNFPRTLGDTVINIKDVAYVYETNRPAPEINAAPLTDKDTTIGKYVAELINDGATIQLGIGNIPNAVAYELKDKHDLGVHSEMFTDSMVDLYECGAITNKKKNYMRGKFVGAFAFGSKKLYDFFDDNPQFYFGRGTWVNHPFTIAKNDNFVAINAALEMDLTGQCNAESIGHSQWSMTGGHHEFTFGGQESKGGKSIIAFHSTANNDEVSRIVPHLGLGSIVSTSRNDMDYIVTEYGIARLKGLNIKQRCNEMIKIAHPKFRDWLKEEAKKYRIW